MTRTPHEIAESIVRNKEWADGKFSTDGDLGEWAKLVALIERELESYARENERLREALEKIMGFGRPLEAPRASYAVCEINTIAESALEETKK